MSPSLPIVSIVGPTASGKSAVSLAVAQLLGGPDAVEIISADAMALYRGMNIGTATLPVEERQGIIHHQIDVLDISQEASVAAYQRHARSDLEAIRRRGRIPLIVGGSGLYVSGILDELDFPGHDSTIRTELEEIAGRQGLAPLLDELKEKDRDSFDTIDRANPRRVIRALEVIRLTGLPYTPKFPRHTSHFASVFSFGIDRSREVLSSAIETRSRRMVCGGLLEETAHLLDQGLRDAPTAARATGYAESIAVLDGDMSEEDAVESIAFHTRRLAKKQRTWFKADPRISWRDLSDGDIDRVARSIVDTVAV